MLLTHTHTHEDIICLTIIAISLCILKHHAVYLKYIQLKNKIQKKKLVWEERKSENDVMFISLPKLSGNKKGVSPGFLLRPQLGLWAVGLGELSGWGWLRRGERYWPPPFIWKAIALIQPAKRSPSCPKLPLLASLSAKVFAIKHMRGSSSPTCKVSKEAIHSRMCI